MKNKVALVVLVLTAASVPASSGPTIEGRWTLVEQHYGEGRGHLVDLASPVHLEFSRRGARLEGAIWAGADDSRRVPWPAFVNDQGPLPVEIVELHADAGSGRIEARYRVRPSPGDDLVLRVTERYELDESGAALTGSMTVEFVVPEGDRGSFVLHRRFERAP